MDVVCIPFHDYKLALSEGFRTRDSHIYSSLECLDYVKRIVIFNRPTLLLQKIIGKKNFNTGGEVIFKDMTITIQRFNSKYYVVDCKDFSLIDPIIKGKSFIPELYLRNLHNYMKALAVLDVSKFVSYESSPLTREFTSQIYPITKIFDGVDNLCKHTTYVNMKSWLKCEYKKIIDGYDFIYFNSKESIEYFQCSDKKNVFFLSNGADFKKFQGEYVIPKQLESFTQRIGVYAGKMQSMFDIDLVKKLSIDHPDVDWVFLGKDLEGNIKQEFYSYRNINFLGDIHYDELPDFIKAADFCIIPYRVDKQHGGDPIKFYEYYSSGAPIVSTPIGNISKFHDGESVHIVTRDDFSAAVEKIKYLKKNHDRPLSYELTWIFKTEIMFGKAI